MDREANKEGRQASTRKRWRAAVIGLGEAAGLAVGALQDLPEIEVLAGVDPRGDQASAAKALSAPVYGEISALSSAGELDLVVISCSSPQHEAAIEQASHLQPRRIWVEKPRVLDRSSRERLRSVFDAIETRTLLHRGFAPEVLEASRRMPQWRSDHGAVTDIECHVDDPYLGDSSRAESLSDCWSDSGINALSVLWRLEALGEVERARGSLPGSAQARLVLNGDSPIEIRCQWTQASQRKFTRIRFVDGTVVVLDHTGARLLAGIQYDELREEYVSKDTRTSRYLAMFRAYLADDGLAPSQAQDEQLHDLLFDVRERITAT